MQEGEARIGTVCRSPDQLADGADSKPAVRRALEATSGLEQTTQMNTIRVVEKNGTTDEKDAELYGIQVAHRLFVLRVRSKDAHSAPSSPVKEELLGLADFAVLYCGDSDGDRNCGEGNQDDKHAQS